MNLADTVAVRMNPSVEHLMSKYLHYRNVVDLLQKKLEKSGNTDNTKKAEKTESDRIVLEFCATQLDEVGALLNRRPRKTTLIWQLLHRVSEQLILVMGEEELVAQGQRILLDLKITSVPDTVRTEWIVKIAEKVKELENHLDTHGGGKDAATAASFNPAPAAQLFKTAANVINECIDDRFWDIWVRKFFAFIYGILLLAIGVLLFFWMKHNQWQFCLDIVNIMLVGAIGGLSSGLITSDQEYMSKGNFWIPTIYYSLVRPSVGAVAAVVVFWMVESHYLIQVEPPLRNCCLTFTCASTNSRPRVNKSDCAYAGEILNITGGLEKSTPARSETISPKTKAPFSNSTGNLREKRKSPSGIVRKPRKGQPGAEGVKGAAPFQNSTSMQKIGAGNPKEGNKGDSLITLKTPEGKQIYMYLLLIFFAGFSGDKILKTVSCKLNAKLFADAEKTKEASK
jgi:hypothetical protein